MRTAQEIAQELGLQDFRLFQQESTWRNLDTYFAHGGMPLYEVFNRRQGKTTRCILAALVHLEMTDAPVIFVAHSKAMAELMTKQARDWALQLGLDPRRISWTTPHSKGIRGLPREQLFTDHHVYEYPRTS